MMAERGLIIAGLVAILLLVTPFAKAEIDSNYIDQGGIRYYIQTDKDVYNLGENVNILYRVSNLTDENISLGWVAADPLAYYDFRVTQDDNRIWRYPYMSYVLGFEPFILQPAQTKEFQTFWNMTNDNGTLWQNDDFLVSSGVYNIVGDIALVPSFGGERIPVSVSIDAIPEPATLLFMAGGMTCLMLRGKRRAKN